MLRQVQSDRSNLAHGWLPFAADSITQQFGTQMPQGGHPPHHSITSSAMASSVGGTHSMTSSAATWSASGTFMPSAFAANRLITSSNLFSWLTGRSDALSPFRILPAWMPASRYASERLVPYVMRPPTNANSRNG